MNPHKLRQMVFAPLGENVTGGGQGDTSGTIAQAKQAVTSTARDIKSAASETASRAKVEAQRVASERKQETADHIRGYGSAIHESAKSLEEQDPNIAWATHNVADRIQGIADYIRDRDFQQLRYDAENLARRHPMVFFGGLFVAGLVVGNLLKARPEQPSYDEDETDWDRGNASGSEALSETMSDNPVTGL